MNYLSYSELKTVLSALTPVFDDSWFDDVKEQIKNNYYLPANLNNDPTMQEIWSADKYSETDFKNMINEALNIVFNKIYFLKNV